MNAIYVFAALAILIIIFLVARRQRHTDLEGLISELKKFEQERMLHLTKGWTDLSDRVTTTRKEMLELIGGPIGFISMRNNAVVILRMLEYFPEPVDGMSDDPELAGLVKEIHSLAVNMQQKTIMAALESLVIKAVPLVPFHGMKTISDYQKMVDLFYQLVCLTQPQMVERLEFVL